MADKNIPLNDIANKLNSQSKQVLIMLSEKEVLTYTDIRNAFGGKQYKADEVIARLEGALLIEVKETDNKKVKPYALTTYGINILKLIKKGE